MDNKSDNYYKFFNQYRKEFDDLFLAINKIPDKTFQHRVIDACGLRSISRTDEKLTKSQGVQVNLDSEINILQIGDSQDSRTVFDYSIIRTHNKETQTSECDVLIENIKKPPADEKPSNIISGKEIKLGRSKRVNVPHVKKDPVAKSARNNAAASNQAKTKKWQPIPKLEATRIQRAMSTEDFTLDDGVLEDQLKSFEKDVESLFVPEVATFNSRKQMKDEWDNSLVLTHGMLPIHDFARDGDLLNLEWQCKILKARSNSVDWLTDDKSETPLQLAVTSTKCNKEMIQLLLHYESNVLEKNDDGNNALHLCALYNNDPDILKLLLEKVTLDDFTVFNYDGMALLHLAIYTEKFHFVRIILDHIDRILSIESAGHNIKDEKELNTILQSHIIAYASEKRPTVRFDPVKMRIINQKNIKSGRTPLFLAISISMDTEIMSFLLMAHGADPRIEDLSGTDCTALSSEILTNKLIATAVYNTVTFLKQHEIDLSRKRYEKPKGTVSKRPMVVLPSVAAKTPPKTAGRKRQTSVADNEHTATAKTTKVRKMSVAMKKVPVKGD